MKKSIKRYYNFFKRKWIKKSFCNVTQKNFDKGKYGPLQVDTKKLQAKYNTIKREWWEIKDRERKGSGLAPKGNPEWYEKLDSILDDTTAALNELVSTSLGTSYSQEVIQNDNENESFEDNAGDDSDKDFYDHSEDDNESNNANKEDKVENVSANKKKAIVVKPHKKRKVVQSQTQPLSQLAGGMTKLNESQAKRHKEQMEFEKERDWAFLEFTKEEVEKNRRHELEIAKIFASSMNNPQQQRDFWYTPFDQTSLFQHSIQQAASSIVSWGYGDNFEPVYFFFTKIFRSHKNTHKQKTN